MAESRRDLRCEGHVLASCACLNRVDQQEAPDGDDERRAVEERECVPAEGRDQRGAGERADQPQSLARRRHGGVGRGRTASSTTEGSSAERAEDPTTSAIP